MELNNAVHVKSGFSNNKNAKSNPSMDVYIHNKTDNFVKEKLSKLFFININFFIYI